MADNADWRLHGQEAFLKGATLVRRDARLSSQHPRWELDHCVFCSAKFSVDESDQTHAGYATPDDWWWICETCFRDFRDRFGWKLASSKDQRSP
jgi:hypothetical protein